MHSDAVPSGTAYRTERPATSATYFGLGIANLTGRWGAGLQDRCLAASVICRLQIPTVRSCLRKPCCLRSIFQSSSHILPVLQAGNSTCLWVFFQPPNRCPAFTLAGKFLQLACWLLSRNRTSLAEGAGKKSAHGASCQLPGGSPGMRCRQARAVTRMKERSPTPAPTCLVAR